MFEGYGQVNALVNTKSLRILYFELHSLNRKEVKP